MPVELWFPVPFLILDAAPAVREATHDKVMKYLASAGARENVTPAPYESVHTTYYRDDTSILHDASLTELEAFVLEAGREFISGLGLAAIPMRFERAWINVFQPGAQEGQHSHDGSLLSATYYVAAPKNCGDLAFPDPVSERRAHRAFTRTSGEHFLLAPEVTFEPQAGRLIMFESWAPHSIHCNKSDEARISLAFNLTRAD